MKRSAVSISIEVAKAEATVAPPTGQRRPVEIVVGTGNPGIVVVAWRAYPVTEGPTGPVDAALAAVAEADGRVEQAAAYRRAAAELTQQLAIEARALLG